MSAYYVCEVIDGDECVIAHVEGISGAIERARVESLRPSASECAVWSVKPPAIIAFATEGLVTVPGMGSSAVPGAFVER